MSQKAISVVIPAFNSAGFIGETLHSILQQTVPVERVVVIDDGSTDETSEIAASFGSKVTCLRTQNQGQGAARAFGIRQVDTDYIALCDSDDLWSPTHIERRLLLLECYPDAALTFSDFDSFGPTARENHSHLAAAPADWIKRWCTVDEQGFYVVANAYRAFLTFNPAYVTGMVFRRDCYLRMGGFREKYSRWIGEDSEFTRRFVSFSEFKVVGDSAQTWSYRRHFSNHSMKTWRNIRARADILEEHLTNRVVPSDDIKATVDEIARSRRNAFDQAYWDKEQDAITSLYWQLPPGDRTWRRMLKRLSGRHGLFLGSKNRQP